MKLVRFGATGAEQPGFLDAEGRLRDASSIVADWSGDALDPAALSALSPERIASCPIVDGDPRIGPCVGSVGKFVCVGLNYSDHAAEAGMEPPSEPILFFKATTAICGPNDDIVIPRGSEKTDWEVELGVVIGRRAKNVLRDDALGVVAGYCVVNDVSERKWQLEQGGQWVKGKSADTFGPIGPWLVTPDEIADVQSLGMRLDVDGRRYQDGSTATMIFAVDQLIAYISDFMTLEPGDIVSTGTPPGVGMGQKPPTYLRPGMTVTLSVDGLGEQRARTVAQT